MQTYIATAPIRNAHPAPLMVHEVPTSRRRQLAANREGKSTLHKTIDEQAPASPATLAREAFQDRRSTQDRVLDRVVDGLMAELGW